MELLAALAWSPKRLYIKLAVLTFVAAVMSGVFMFWMLTDYGGTSAVLVQQAKFSQYRFSPRLSSYMMGKDASGVPIHISEIEFKNVSGIVSLAGVVARNPGGLNPSGEGPEKAIDGDRNTKWLDFSRAPIVIVFPRPITLTSFRFVTSKDSADRDPTRWMLEGSNGKGWTLLHMQNTDHVSQLRAEATDWFDWFDFDEPNWGDYLRTWGDQGEVAASEVPDNGPVFLQCRFTPSKLRRQDSGGVQISEIEFKNGDAVVSLAKEARNNQVRADMLGGFTEKNEEPNKAIDGDRNTKWFDYGKGSLTITWQQPQRLTAFRFVTANDYSGRDPIQWSFQCSQDKSTWALSHLQDTDYPTPIVRRTSTEWFDFDLTRKAVQEFLPDWNVPESNFTFADGNDSYSADGDASQSQDDVEYCFTSTKLRSEESGVIQISELEFKNGVHVVTWPEHTVTFAKDRAGGNSMLAIDGDNSTNWFSMHPATLCIRPPTEIHITSFRFKTADRFIGRDPIQWTLTRRSNRYLGYIFVNNTEGYHSTMLHLQSTDYPTPLLRQAPTEWFDINLTAVPVFIPENHFDSDPEDDDDNYY